MADDDKKRPHAAHETLRADDARQTQAEHTPREVDEDAEHYDRVSAPHETRRADDESIQHNRDDDVDKDTDDPVVALVDHDDDPTGAKREVRASELKAALDRDKAEKNEEK